MTAILKDVDAIPVNLSEDEKYQVLSAERCRSTLDILEEGDAMTLTELAAKVANREHSLDGSDEEAVQRVAVSLHHKHLPKLASLDILDYDSDKRLISR